MKLGIVCVHYHAADLAVRAVRAAMEDACRAGLDVEARIVDNGSTAEEAHALAQSGLAIHAQGNEGYAAGVNLGAELMSDAQIWLFMNPDVLVEDGCVGALVREIQKGAAVAGPRFFWDCLDGFHLPPTEPVGLVSELGRIWSAARPQSASSCRRAWRRHARRHWLASSTLESYDLSGAMMAVDARAWHRVGPFDRGYTLYFEETDWLRRAQQSGEKAVFVPDARAVHLYAQSTPSEPRITRWFEESRQRFRELHYGRLSASAFGRLERWIPRRDMLLPPVRREGVLEAEIDWVEISPSPAGFPAAGLRVAFGNGSARSRKVPSDALIDQMAPGTYFVRLLSSDEERALYRLER